MRLDQLKYLVAIVQCGSINKAAQKLAVSQPAVSVAIKELEAELKVPLLKRSKAGTTPTQYGLEVIREYISMDQSMNNWKYLVPGTKDVVHLIYFTEFSAPVLFKYYYLMKDKYPQIDLRLSTNRKTLYEINVDNAILHTCSSDELDKMLYNTESQYEVTHLFKEKFCVYVCADNPLSKKDSVEMRDLSGMAVAGKDHRKGFPFRDIINEMNCPSVYLGSNENILRAISKDLAFSIMPESFANDNIYVESGRIVPLEIADADFPLYHYMLTPLGRTLSPNEQIAADMLKQFYPEIMQTER